MKFESTGTKHTELKEESFAVTPHEAAKYFFDTHRQWPDAVCEVAEEEDAEPICHCLVTACEYCGEPIFEGEEYVSGEDCDMHPKCASEDES